MKTKININGKEVEITLTSEQVKEIQKCNLEITERIKVFKDACDYLGIKTHGDAYRVLNMKRNHMHDVYIQDCEDTYLRLCIYTLALNEGIPVNMKKENRYFPYFNHNNKPGSGFFPSHFDYWLDGWSSVSSRLALRASKLAMYSGQQFEQEYYDYMYN